MCVNVLHTANTLNIVNLGSIFRQFDHPTLFWVHVADCESIRSFNMLLKRLRILSQNAGRSVKFVVQTNQVLHQRVVEHQRSLEYTFQPISEANLLQFMTSVEPSMVSKNIDLDLAIKVTGGVPVNAIKLAHVGSIEKYLKLFGNLHPMKFLWKNDFDKYFQKNCKFFKDVGNNYTFNMYGVTSPTQSKSIELELFDTIVHHFKMEYNHILNVWFIQNVIDGYFLCEEKK